MSPISLSKDVSCRKSPVVDPALPDDVKLFMERCLSGIPAARGERVKRRFDHIRSEEDNLQADDVRLPYDVIAAIGEILKEEAKSHTWGRHPLEGLATLNRTSKIVRAITLPALYESAAYSTEETLLQSMRTGRPPGWAYTKNLCLSHDNHLLLQQHLRETTALEDRSGLDDVDLRSAFPRLEILVVEKVNMSERRGRAHIHVELFKPIPLESFRARCRLPWTDPDHYGLCVMGIRIVEPRWKPEPDDQDIHEIATLVIHPGAGILSPPAKPTDGSTGTPWIGITTEFSLVIHEQTGSQFVESTFEVLLDIARQVPRSPTIVPGTEYDVFYVAILLKCTSSVLDCFTQVLSCGDLPSVDLDISLRAKWATDETVLRHLHALGDVCSFIWCYDKHRADRDWFLKIDSLAAVPRKLSSGRGYATDSVQIRLEGTLSPGQQDSPNGFRSQLRTKIDFLDINDIDYHPATRWITSYPCEHVRLPAGWALR